jgi:Protein of unknown function (DUF2939)
MRVQTLIWIASTAWPIYDLLALIRAIEIRDAQMMTQHVYFDAVRRSLANQIVAAYVRRAGIQISPLARSMAVSSFAVADPIDKLISPQALSELLAIGWPGTVAPNPPQGTVGISRNTIGTIWQIFENSEYGFLRFELFAPASSPPSQRWSHVQAATLAMAVGWCYLAREYSESAGGRIDQDDENPCHAEVIADHSACEKSPAARPVPLRRGLLIFAILPLGRDVHQRCCCGGEGECDCHRDANRCIGRSERPIQSSTRHRPHAIS